MTGSACCQRQFHREPRSRWTASGKEPDELDCHTDEAFAAPELVKMAIQAEKDGYDAIVIYCFSDVGLEALRENVKIPVIAPAR